MCLKRTSRIYTSKKDKVVYKVFCTHPDTGEPITPFRKMDITTLMYISCDLKRDIGIHAYLKRQHAEILINDLKRNNQESELLRYAISYPGLHILKMIIPEGTRYVYGMDNSSVATANIIKCIETECIAEYCK